MTCFTLPYIDIDSPGYLRTFELKTDIPYEYYYNRYCTLDERLHSWMEDNRVEYTIRFISLLDEWRICISDIDQAMIYKLTWG